MSAGIFTEEELLPLSALQHVVFCERQCALIHVEQQWKENPLTLQGAYLHNRTDDPALICEKRGDLVILRGLALRSLKLGVSGKADVVELRRSSSADDSVAKLPGLNGLWAVRPVEYKRGRPKKNRCDQVQLCAQAICLEEMLRVTIKQGDLYYGANKRRQKVVFDTELREFTFSTAERLRTIFDSRVTPRGEEGPKCRNCSLQDICMPSITGTQQSARSYTEENVMPGKNDRN